jgi:hypothetical protein
VLRPVSACLALCLADPARAGGGAHIVDDDATLPAGVCHVESWLTLAGEGGGFAVANSACTLKALPRLEIAVAVQRTFGDDVATTIAPALKLNLRSFEEAPMGVAVSATAVWSPRENRIETIAVTVPVSARVNERLVVHGNLGWINAPGEADRNALFWGAQAVFEFASDMVLMGEVFGTDRRLPGGQVGLRWVTDRGRIDMDLLAGHRIDGIAAASVTLGLTIRR